VALVGKRSHSVWFQTNEGEKMKMLMAIIDSSKKEELESVLKREGITGFTEIPNANGFGSTGMKMGSAAFPGSSAVIYALLEEEILERVASTIKSYCSECTQHMRLLHWDVTVEI
jgi:uncharacterized protein YaaQ